MGKHSLPDSPGFWRAVFLAGLRYLVVLVLVLAVGFGVYKLVFDRGDDTPETEETLSPLATDPFVSPTPTESPSPDASPSPSPPPAGSSRTQVLDGSNSQARLDSAERKLEAAGYDVVAKGNASSPYEKTTVFYHPGAQQTGEAVASLVGATLVQPVGDRNLDPAIPVTVVVGPDYAG
jgi:hypothetical protein